MPVTITPSMLFKTAAFLNAISIPGHIAFGFQVHPVLNTIKTDRNRTALVGKTSAQACFNYVNGALLVAALLNWQWARDGGPKTLEERAVFWTIVANGFVDGLTYLRGAREYGPLGCMWVAPAASVAAYTLF